MKPQLPKLKCPNCGAEMNHHAEKIDYTAGLKDPRLVDATLGGVLDEYHMCPKCGAGASRRAPAA